MVTNRKIAPDGLADGTRVIEKTLALFRYEMHNENGCGQSALLEELLEYVKDVLLNPEGDGENGDISAAQSDEIDAKCPVVSDHLIRALFAIGFGSEAQAYVERIAERRRECEAQFSQPRSTPFTPEEKERLAEAWRASAHEAEASQGGVQ